MGEPVGKESQNFSGFVLGKKSPKFLERDTFIYLDDYMQDFIFLIHFPAENPFL